MNVDDYESLPTTNVIINMTAGAMAGILEHCIMYPLDSVKTRMQSLVPAHSNYNIAATLRNMIRKEGLLRPIRGINAVIVGAGPAHALYFGTYEFTKELLTNITIHSSLNYVISGMMATIIHDAVSNPTEVIKQRMQMYNSSYQSVIACMTGIYRTEGITAFYRSYSTQLMMNIPYQAVHFATYEFFQNMFNHERKYNPPVHVLAGGAAGATAAAITTPLDVVKTLLNTQETGLTRGMAEASKQIYSVAGVRGFFKGFTARTLYSMPATAICWSTYEFFKFYLCGIDREKYKSSISGKSHLQPRDTAAMLPTGIVTDVAMFEVKATDKATTAYVLSATAPNSKDDPRVMSVSSLSSSSASSTSSSSSSTPPPPPSSSPPATASGSIKSVCELSSSVPTTPALNLHTRHTEVKSPYNRRFSSP